MTKEIASGMSLLESKRVIHRDLSLRNILVKASSPPSKMKYVVKISDFGLSQSIESSYFITTGNFPVKWSAPEVLEYGTCTTKSDVWSFGILLWEMFSYGKLPFSEFSAVDVVPKVLNGYIMAQPLNCPNEMYDLMKRCWMKETENRPTFADILQTVEEMM